MNVKLTSCLSGDRFTFFPGQTIKASDRTGANLIREGMAVEAPAGVEPEGTLYDHLPKEERVETPPKKQPERATKVSGAESAITGPPPEHCEAQTKQGNSCLRTPIPGSRFCAAHAHKS